MSSLEEKIDKLLTNDLPHIQQTLSQLVTEVGWLKYLFGAVTLAMIYLILKK